MPNTLTVSKIRVLNEDERKTIEYALIVLADLPAGTVPVPLSQSARSMLNQDMDKQLLWAEPVS